jgi:pimeloyl-ACP methyl ester carboxylesterase
MADSQNVPKTLTQPKLFDIFWHKYVRRPYKLTTHDHGDAKSDLPVIILLHGLASSSANWKPLIPLLKDRYRCITIDLVGFGDSPKPQWYEYSMDEHIRDIRRTIWALRLKKPFTLAGHSLGSLIATRYARELPKHVNRLVLLSPPVYAPLNTIESRSARQRTALYLRAYRFIRTNKKITPENVLRLTRILPFMKFVVLNEASWLPFVRSLEQCIENQTIIDDIVAVQAPVDVFFGVFDEVVVPYNVRSLADLRDVQLHPLKVNHIVTRRYAEQVAKILLTSQQPPKLAVTKH